MDTIVLPIEEGLTQARELLTQGEIVGIPTETVYGLAANAYDGKAIDKVFAAKGRPQDNPLIVHIGSLDEIHWVTDGLTPEERFLFEFYSPGPLTLIVQKFHKIHEKVTTGLEKVGLRIPHAPLTQKLINLCGFPLAAPSANLSGEPSPTNAQMVAKSLDQRIPLVLDGGNCQTGLESTIIMLKDNKVHQLRPGAINPHKVIELLQSHGFDYQFAQTKLSEFRSPGSRYRHYAPKAQITIIEHDNEADLSLSHFDSCKSFARELYQELERADQNHKNIIKIALPKSLDLMHEDYALTEALRDRIRRAAGYT